VKRIRTEPHNDGSEGDERIRTAVTRYSGFSRYESSPLTTVYFVQDAHGPIKIGHAADLRSRLRGLQAGNPRELTVLGYFVAPRAFERYLHSVLMHHCLHGEWFIDCPEVRDALAVSLEMWGSWECDECEREARYLNAGHPSPVPAAPHTCPEGLRSKGRAAILGAAEREAEADRGGERSC